MNTKKLSAYLKSVDARLDILEAQLAEMAKGPLTDKERLDRITYWQLRRAPYLVEEERALRGITEELSAAEEEQLMIDATNRRMFEQSY